MQVELKKEGSKILFIPETDEDKFNLGLISGKMPSHETEWLTSKSQGYNKCLLSMQINTDDLPEILLSLCQQRN